MKFTAVILMQTRLTFEHVCNSLEDNKGFANTMKIHYVLKGLCVNPKTRITKKRSQQKGALVAPHRFVGGSSKQVEEICTESKREGGYAVHLAQQ